MKEQEINGRILNELELVRFEKLSELEKANYDVYGRKWDRNYNSEKLIIDFGNKTKEELLKLAETVESNQIIIAGRIMTKRVMGKASIFATLQDQAGEFQIYLNNKVLDEQEFALFSDYADIGDFFGIEGKAMKTNTGELTVKVFKLVMLAKAIRPLPDKYHGIKDIEERYRRRYVDLIMNKNSFSVFIKRTKILQALRDFLNKKGAIEVETPILQDIYGGAAAKPFVTFHNTLNINLYLRIATELHLKRLIIGGFEAVYEIGRLFRNEGMSPKHNPEFTTVEVYVAYQDMNYMMKLTEDCINYIVQTINESLVLDHQVTPEKKITIDFGQPWKQITMIDAIKEYAPEEVKKSFAPLTDLIAQYDANKDETATEKQKAEALRLATEIAEKHKVHIGEHQKSVGHIINLFFEHFVEEKLMQPTFIYSYPVEISPLSKLTKGSMNFTDRFELFIGGREYANAYSELNNPIEQYERFLDQIKEKKAGNDEATSMMDLDFVEALEYGMPPTAGLGIGIDRLVMLITQQNSIKDVLFFPQLKPRNQESN